MKKTSILFVDDEPRVLEGLRRSLRGSREEWDMHFANGGEEALTLMQREPVDVIVTDMCMPGMDGAELLRRVRSRHPASVRLVLSGQFSKAAGLRAVAVAHQFLPKPTAPMMLKAAVVHSLAVREILTADEVRRAAGAIGALPFRPQTHAALLKVLDKPDVALEEITAVIERDSMVAAKILHVVNSAFLGVSQPVGSILQAVQLLGIENLKQVALSAEIMTNFHIPPERDFPVEQFHNHAQVCAQIVARLPLPESLAAQSVMAALLHDLGKLVLASQMVDRFDRVYRAVLDGKRTWIEAETEQLGANHAEIGAYLLGLWGLPKPLVAAVLEHHRPLPEPSSEWTISEAVRIANALAGEAEDRTAGRPAASRPELAPDRLQALGCAHLLGSWRDVAASAWQQLNSTEHSA